MKPVTSISLARIAIGAAAVAQPDLTAKLFRLDQANNPQLPYMTRMFGSREIALGLITATSKGRSRRLLAALGIAVDGSDAFAGFDAGRSGAVSQSTSGFLTAPAVLAMLAGVLGIFEKDRTTTPKAEVAPESA